MKLIGQTHFRLVYGVEMVMPMEYIMLSLCIVVLIGMMDHKALEERLAWLDEVEEELFLAVFHQQAQQWHENTWHDQHIKLFHLRKMTWFFYMIVSSKNFQGNALVRALCYLGDYQWRSGTTDQIKWRTLPRKSEWRSPKAIH